MNKSKNFPTKTAEENPSLLAKKYSFFKNWSVSPGFHLALIALIGLLAYSNSFHVPFIFDDESSIVDNPVIKNLQSFIWDGAGYRFNSRRFIGYLTIALNYNLGGLSVFGYHIFNVVVHITSALLVYAALTLTLKTSFFTNRPPLEEQNQRGNCSSYYLIPLLTALLFVSHPIQSQAVTYIIQRLASLATMFYLLALVLYIRARLEQEASERLFSPIVLCFYCLAVISALLAMKTKEIAATLPLTVILYEFSFFKTTARKRLLFLVPLCLTLFIVPLGMLYSGKPLGELLSDVNELARETKNISRGDYLLTQFSVITTYLRLIILPIGQNLDYDYPVFHSLFSPQVFFAFILLVAFFCLAIYLYYRSRPSQPISSRINPELRLAGFGILWFFITLSIESSIIPISDVIYEHRVYLPSFGAFSAAVVILLTMGQRLTLKYIAWSAGAIILILTAVTWQRNQVWATTVSIWQDTSTKSSAKVRPYNNLATALMAQGNTEAAIEQLHTALKLEPTNGDSLRNLGAAYEKSGRLDESIALYQRSLATKPNNAFAHYNMGISYAKQGLSDLAIEQFLLSLKINPEYADAYNNLGVAYGSKGLLDEAIEQFQKAIKLNPDAADAHNNLGLAFWKKGQQAEAAKEFMTTIKLQPSHAEAYNNLGIVYGTQGAFEKAAEYFQKALTIQPSNTKYSINLANANRQKPQ